MIKDARELTAQEMTEFRSIFIQYFNESCTTTGGKTPKFLESFMTSVRNKKYVIDILRMIKEGKKQGFVSLDDAEESVTGFLVGGNEGEVGVITHLYVDVKCPMGRRIQSLELYRAFSHKMSTSGVSQMKACSHIKDEDLNDALLSLGFSIVDKKEAVNEYARSIA